MIGQKRFLATSMLIGLLTFLWEGGPAAALLALPKQKVSPPTRTITQTSALVLRHKAIFLRHHDPQAVLRLYIGSGFTYPVHRWVASVGLTVPYPDVTNVSIEAEGTTATVERAFHVRINDYRVPSRNQFNGVPAGAPSSRQTAIRPSPRG